MSHYLKRSFPAKILQVMFIVLICHFIYVTSAFGETITASEAKYHIGIPKSSKRIESTFTQQNNQ